MTVQAGLCRTCPETTLLVFSLCGSFIFLQLRARVTDGGGLFDTLPIQINVIRNNDCPSFSSSRLEYVIDESTNVIEVDDLSTRVTDSDPDVSKALVFLLMHF